MSKKRGEVQRDPVVVEITRLYDQIYQALRLSLDKALRIGELLARKKEQLGHGLFTDWVKKQLPLSERTARNYMRLCRERQRLQDADVASLSEAYALLALVDDKTATVAVLTEEPAKASEPVNVVITTVPAEPGEPKVTYVPMVVVPPGEEPEPAPPRAAARAGGGMRGDDGADDDGTADEDEEPRPAAADEDTGTGPSVAQVLCWAARRRQVTAKDIARRFGLSESQAGRYLNPIAQSRGFVVQYRGDGDFLVRRAVHIAWDRETEVPDLPGLLQGLYEDAAAALKLDEWDRKDREQFLRRVLHVVGPLLAK
jgi:hypothetical protein